MRIQVVHCHPLIDSYDHALYFAIVETLAARGQPVTATDLCREDFRPAMTEVERRTCMGNGYDRSAIACRRPEERRRLSAGSPATPATRC